MSECLFLPSHNRLESKKLELSVTGSDMRLMSRCTPACVWKYSRSSSDIGQVTHLCLVNSSALATMATANGVAKDVPDLKAFWDGTETPRVMKLFPLGTRGLKSARFPRPSQASMQIMFASLAG